jgi:hypothetical protein
VICLTSDHYQHPDYGRVETPALDIVRWIDPPKDLKVIRPPAAASPGLAIEHSKSDTRDKNFGSDFGTAPDDEIPF